MQHLIYVVIFCRVFFHIHSLEQLLEVVLLVDVVVSFEHAQKQTLAEAAWADKEEEVTRQFHPLKEHGFIDQVLVFFPHLLKVGDAVGNALEIVAHR